MIPAERLTIRAAEALNTAAELARREGNPAVEDLHLLAALLEQDEGIIDPILRKVGADPSVVAGGVRAGLERLPRQSGAAPAASRELVRVLDDADSEARSLADQYVSTEHLLVALAGKAASSTSEVLAAAGATQPTESSVHAHGHDGQCVRRKIPVDAFPLGHVADPRSALRVRGVEDPDPTGDRFDQPQNRFEQCALAGAVGTHDRDQLPLWQLEIDVPQYRLGAVGDRQVVNFDRRNGQGIGVFVHRFTRHAGRQLRALTIVLTLCRTMPAYVPSGVPGAPMASENN